MSENTKFNLEYAIKQGYRVTDDFAASLVMFEKKHYTNNTNWEVFIDWRNGNYQELNLSVSTGNQWVEMTNPGSAGIYYLLIRKGTPDQYRAHFARHDGINKPGIEWLGEPLTDQRLISMASGTALLITLLWDGTKYVAYIVPNEIFGKTPKHGYLYNWYAVNSGKLDIPGWRVPTRNDYTALSQYLGIDQGYYLKASSPDWNGNDSYGFKALPTGFRNNAGEFHDQTSMIGLWTSTEYSSTNAYCRYLITSNWTFYEFSTLYKKNGYSIRLIRNGLDGYTTGEKVKDIDGNVYDTVRITLNEYDEVWLVQNLATSRYNDGSGIPYITNNSIWSNLNTGAISSYNNNLSNVFEQ